VDTPGLESVFDHNTDASLEWLPNVGLALVAVGVDPPLSRHDIELIRNLSRYTPNISLLLTKVDVLDESERGAGSGFRTEAACTVLERCGPRIPLLVRPGFERSARNSTSASCLKRTPTSASNMPPFCATRWTPCWGSAPAI